MTAAPPQAPESQDSPPSTARLLSVLAIVLVVCAGLVLAGIYLARGSSGDPGQGADGAPAAKQAPSHDLPAAEAPTIRLTATPDSAGGWNLRIVTSRFTWAPASAGAPHADGEGHAHVWVGGTKIGRAYGEWFYLPEQFVPVGEQTVRVGLNSNDHGDYLAAGTPVSASVTIVSTAETAADGHHHQH